MSDALFVTLVAWAMTVLFAVVTVWSPGAINAMVGCGVVALVGTLAWVAERWP